MHLKLSHNVMMDILIIGGVDMNKIIFRKIAKFGFATIIGLFMASHKDLELIEDLGPWRRKKYGKEILRILVTSVE